MDERIEAFEKCPKCKSKRITTDMKCGIVICQECGLVLQENIMIGQFRLRDRADIIKEGRFYKVVRDIGTDTSKLPLEWKLRKDLAKVKEEIGYEEPERRHRWNSKEAREAVLKRWNMAKEKQGEENVD